MLEVFIDESGTHGGSPVVVVAAYLARPEQWAAFTAAWNDAIRPAVAWHATDAAACKEHFEAWTPTEVAVVAKRALPLIPKHVESGIAIAIQMQDFEEALRGRPELRAQIGTPYGACLHWLMATILKEKAEAGNVDRVAFFHETNEYRGEALETYAHMQNTWNPLGARLSFSFGGKADYVPLQAADILAFEANWRLRSRDLPDRKSLTALRAEGANLRIRLYDRDNLPWLVERLEAARLRDAPDAAGEGVV